MDKQITKYYDLAWARREIGEGAHRAWIGGMWEEIGRLQFDFLTGRGLDPAMRVLDLGCGCFRAGVHLIDYLQSGCYYGVDLSRELLDAGYERELTPLGLDRKLPRDNLLCDDQFRLHRFGVRFDMGLAQSLFTHLPMNHIRLCMTRLVDVFAPGAVFYATAFLCPPGTDWRQPVTHSPGGVVTSPIQDPYHYRARDFEQCIEGLPWSLDVIGDWGHPRAQSMLQFTRTD